MTLSFVGHLRLDGGLEEPRREREVRNGQIFCHARSEDCRRKKKQISKTDLEKARDSWERARRGKEEVHSQLTRSSESELP